ncbi:MAG: hypothetical protein CMJ51_00410 [Planctomycetaceae bacterium]|nr:hypothetical protein [Planctomycetaceae bacterium]
MNITAPIRLALAAAFVASAIAIATVGGDAVPLWIIGVAARTGLEPELAARLTTGACVALAGVLLVLGRRGRIPAILAAGALAFSGIADGSALLSLGDDASVGFLRPALQLLVGVIAFIGLLRGKPDERKLRHPMIAGSGVVISVVMGAAVAANLSVAMPDGFRNQSSARGSDGRFAVNELDSRQWIGQRIEDTPLNDHLPAVRALAADQPTLISFYRPNCDSCHDLFDGHFGKRLPARVIAIRVPPAEGVTMAESDLPDDVYCADCVKLTLPEGPVWLVESPVVIEVVDGVVTCVSTDDYDRCISDAVTQAEAFYRQELEESKAG